MISVCVATYNGGKYVEKQIRSILKQLGPDDEIIVSDDGSTDGTLKILGDFNDSRLKILSHRYSGQRKKYSGNHYPVTSNFENALLHAKGDIVFLSDQDDIWHDNRVKIMSAALKSATLVYAPFDVIDENDVIISTPQPNTPSITKHIIKDIISQPYFGCCMAFRRSLLDIALPFPDNLIMHDNWIGLLAEISGSKIEILKEPLLYYRHHSNNVSRNHNKNPLWFRIGYRLRLLIQLVGRRMNPK